MSETDKLTNSRRPARSKGIATFFGQFGEMAHEFGHFGRGDKETVGLVGVFAEIALMVWLGREKLGQRGYFGNHPARPSFPTTLDSLPNGNLLQGIVKVGHRAILSTPIRPLLVEGGRIVNHEKHIQ